MNCPKCNADTLVIDGRPVPGNRIRRRRRCEKCGHRFSTIELNAEGFIDFDEARRLLKRITEVTGEYHQKLKDLLP